MRNAGGGGIFGCSCCGGAYFEQDGRRSTVEDYWGDDLVNNAVYSSEVVQSAFRRKFDRYLRQLDRLDSGRKALLEIGCGSGLFLAEAVRHGWTVHGLDVSPQAVELARRSCPEAAVTQGPLTATTFPPDSFDVVALWDVIEHVEDPEQLLRYAHGTLTDKGRLIMETPDEGCLARKLIRLAHLFTAGHVSLLHTIYYSAHRWYFSRPAMRIVLERLGFKKIQFYREQTVMACGERKLEAYHLLRRWSQCAVSLGTHAMAVVPALRNKMVVIAGK
jgi:2-polyprenyl-3-methyl-5-hydroxy-6-metoxy-1,4-benzoquinol methylase